MNAAVARWVLARLETPCPDACDNGRLPNTEALTAHEMRLAEARKVDGWNAARHTAREAYLAVARSAPSETAPCPTCSGRGVVLTDAGRAALAFLNRHGGTR